MIHVVAGDSAVRTLRQAALPGEVAVFRDLLAEGPLPAGGAQRRTTTRASMAALP